MMHRHALPLRLPLLALVLAGQCAGEASAQAACNATGTGPGLRLAYAAPSDAPAVLAQLTGQQPNANAKAALNDWVTQAIANSPGVQSARRNLSAAEYDLQEQRSASRPQVALNGSLTSAYTRVNVMTQPNPGLGAMSVGMSAPLYDGGRLSSLQAWRESLRDASQLTEAGNRENLAAEVVSFALERERYALQARVFQRYKAQMGCLLNALEQIVKEDRGRASELIQARKSLAQAQLSVDEAEARVRQVEVQLTRLVGAQALAARGLGGALIAPPLLGTAQDFLEHSLPLKELRAEAESQKRLAESLRLAYRPQLSWSVLGSSGRTADGTATSNSWQAGLNFNATLYSGGGNDAGYKAALARADAARFRLEQAETEQLARVNELRAQVDQAWSRATQLAQLLNDSDQVRRNTQELWFLLGRRSLFDLMAAESDYYGSQASFVNAVFDALQGHAQLRNAGSQLTSWLATPDGARQP